MSKVLQRGTAIAYPCRDRQPGFRHGRAGSDANIPLEEGGTVPGAG